MSDEYLEKYVDLIIQYAKYYLGAGGSTSRLEESLTDFGEKLGIDTEVFATSTGVFVTCTESQHSHTITRMGRILRGENDMAELIRLENILTEMQHSRQVMDSTRQQIVNESSHSFGKVVFFAALFIFGVSHSLPKYGSLLAALGSGLIVSLVFWMSGAFSKRLGLTGVFTEFLGCCVIFSTSGLLGLRFGLPPKAFAEGAMILMVPGLTITNAISELANHNFISGTSKMMRAILTLMAMGTAFLLVNDVAALVVGEALVQARATGFQPSYLLSFLGLLGSISAVSILFNVPGRLVPFSLITGIGSWLVLQSVEQSGFYALGSFLPALSVGLFSLSFGRWFKVPSQVFSVPGILSLVPGMLALSSFFQFSQVGESQQSIGMRVMIVASSIVFGLFTARIPFILLQKKKLYSD